MLRLSSPPAALRAWLGGLLVLAMLAMLAGGLTGAARAAAAPVAQENDPLQVHIESLQPAALRPGKPVTITGTVTNASDEEWTAVNLHAFRSTSPITDATSLAASAKIDPDEYVGSRVTAPGTFATIDVLDPGQTEFFEFTVPWSDLGIPDQAGAYWIGVHALGDSSVPRDGFADGKARTFVPLVAGDPDPVPTAMVLPLRARVVYAANGRLAQVRRWRTTLAPGGRLDNLVAVAESTSSLPTTWVVDPAVLAAVSRLAAGNPGRSLAPDPSVPPEEQPGQQPTPSDAPTTDPPGGVPSAGSPGLDGGPAIVPPINPERTLSEKQQQTSQLATLWLSRLTRALAGHDVLALPYGDLDADAAMRTDPGLLQKAATRSRQVMTQLGLPARVALVPESGVSSPEAIEAAPPGASVLLADTSFAVPPATSTALVRMLGHKVVVTSSGAASGGPGPTPADEPLALRQRLLSEAALRVGSGSQAPLVLSLPAMWNPGIPGTADTLFDAMDEPWIQAVDIAELERRSAASGKAADLAYTDADQAAELGSSSFEAAEELRVTAERMEQVLTATTLVEAQASDEALTSLSVLNRARPVRALLVAREAADRLQRQLSRIRIVAPQAVTLSSRTGPIGITVVNGLPQPVTVELRVRSDGALTMDDPGPLQLQASSRQRRLLTVTASRIGVHDMSLEVTDQDGDPLGGSAQLPIRAAEVSTLIWYLIAGALATLLGAIGLRLWRRARRARHADRTDPEPTDQPSRTGPDGAAQRPSSTEETTSVDRSRDVEVGS